MTEEERNEEQAEDVEGHGVKQVAAAGLAGAALIGAGAGAVKLATDDDRTRDQAALVADRSAAERLAKADRDRDGYVTQQDLDDIGFKVDVKWMKVEGFEVTEDAMAAAGSKIEIELVGKHEGFPLEGETIMLKPGVSKELDTLAKTDAQEWTSKIRELDRDEDGYLDYEVLAGGHKLIMKWDELEKAGDKHLEVKELVRAGVKIRAADLGEGGFAMEGETIFLRFGVDEKLDAFIKGEKES